MWPGGPDGKCPRLLGLLVYNKLVHTPNPEGPTGVSTRAPGVQEAGARVQEGKHPRSSTKSRDAERRLRTNHRTASGPRRSCCHPAGDGSSGKGLRRQAACSRSRTYHHVQQSSVGPDVWLPQSQDVSVPMEHYRERESRSSRWGRPVCPPQ